MSSSGRASLGQNERSLCAGSHWSAEARGSPAPRPSAVRRPRRGCCRSSAFFTVAERLRRILAAIEEIAARRAGCSPLSSNTMPHRPGTALIVDASPSVHPSSAQGLRRPIGAWAAVSWMITASVGVRITIVDIARTDMRRIMTAVVVVGPIIGEIARSYRQVRPWAAATMLDLNHIIPGAFAGLQKGLPGRCGAS